MKAVTEEQSQQRQTLLVDFLQFLRRAKPFEAHRTLIRVLPKGIFVDDRGLKPLLEAFQGWRHEQTQGAADKTDEKTRQWLFETSTPERMYLVEGRTSLVGALIPVEIKAPQQFGLPYYLGSLLPASEYLHEGDPEIQAIPGITVGRSATGLEVEVQRRHGNLIVSEDIIKSFASIAKGSRYLQRRYPESESKLIATLKALVSIVKRARVVPKNVPMIVPYAVKREQAKQVLVAGKFLFIAEGARIRVIVELNGRHLSTFLREELSKAPKKRFGSFHLTSKHRDLLGFYQVGGIKNPVHARAFSDFVELIRLSRDPKERFTGWFTALDCFERFSMIFQTAQSIDKKMILSSLKNSNIEGVSFRISDGWIFALARDKTVMRTTARHIRSKKHTSSIASKRQPARVA